LAESVEYVVRLIKQQGTGIVTPLTVEQGSELENTRSTTERALEPRLQVMKKDGYVRVISGIHKGKYGILSRASAGRFEVRQLLHGMTSYHVIYYI
jgi:hypothetical protein